MNKKGVKMTSGVIKNMPVLKVYSNIIIVIMLSSFCVSAQPLWDGLNPFHQPAKTTNYYGSGDVDGDGIVTQADVNRTTAIVAGSASPDIRADVDGSGVVDSDDIVLLQSALSGAILPAWWNYLTTREQRLFWVQRMMAMVRTKGIANTNPTKSFFYCGNYASQFAVEAAYLRTSLRHSNINGSQFFNVPVYNVELSGHSINAVLIGDNPLNINDWFFIEPLACSERTYLASPYAYIAVLTGVNSQSYPLEQDVLMFDSIKGFSPSRTGVGRITTWKNVVLSRPSPPVYTPQNRIDLWNPILIPDDNNGRVLFEKVRDEMKRTNDIHISSLPIVHSDNGSASGVPLVHDSQFSRIMDCKRDSAGNVHLLWRGIPNNTISLFYGRLSVSGSSLENVSLVGTITNNATASIDEAKLLLGPNGTMNVIYTSRDNGGRAYDSCGISWHHYNGSSWGPRTMIYSIPYTLPDGPPYRGYMFLSQNTKESLFDAVQLKDGKIRMVVLGLDSAIYEMCYVNSVWQSPVLIESGSIIGVAMGISSKQTPHIAYWKSDLTLHHRYHDGIKWQYIGVIDRGEINYARFASSAYGDMFLTWQKLVNNKNIPLWSTYSGGLWHHTEILPVRADANAFYPGIAHYSNANQVRIIWESRGSDYSTIETVTRNYVSVHCDSLLQNCGYFGTRQKQIWAGNSITAGPEYTIYQPGNVELRAGYTIKLKPGVSVQQGSTLKAFIDQNLFCNP